MHRINSCIVLFLTFLFFCTNGPTFEKSENLTDQNIVWYTLLTESSSDITTIAAAIRQTSLQFDEGSVAVIRFPAVDDINSEQAKKWRSELIDLMIRTGLPHFYVQNSASEMVHYSKISGDTFICKRMKLVEFYRHSEKMIEINCQVLKNEQRSKLVAFNSLTNRVVSNQILEGFSELALTVKMDGLLSRLAPRPDWNETSIKIL